MKIFQRIKAALKDFFDGSICIVCGAAAMDVLMQQFHNKTKERNHVPVQGEIEHKYGADRSAF